MRDIIFRGKKAGANIWLYGQYYSYYKKRKKKQGNEVVQEEKEEVPCIYENEEPSGTEIAPETLGQFTGLYDKEGFPIYEGDIVRVADKDDYVRTVEYKNGGFGFLSWDKNHWYPFGFHWEIVIDSKSRCIDIEVIGNIHDNPEIMKRGDL